MTKSPRGETARSTTAKASTAKAAGASRRGRGTRSKQTQLRVDAILTSLRHGSTRTAAAAAAGVSKDALRRWMELDAKFAEEVETAEGAMVTSLVNVVYNAATKKGDWIAAMTLLERRVPQDWGRRDRVEISVEVREEAKRLADELGLDEGEVMAEAERILDEDRKRSAGKL